MSVACFSRLACVAMGLLAGCRSTQSSVVLERRDDVQQSLRVGTGIRPSIRCVASGPWDELAPRIDFRELLGAPETHVGALVQVEARIRTGYDMQALLDGDLMHSVPATWDEELAVRVRGCFLETQIQGTLREVDSPSPRQPKFVFHVSALRPAPPRNRTPVDPPEKP